MKVMFIGLIIKDQKVTKQNRNIFNFNDQMKKKIKGKYITFSNLNK